MTTMPGRLFGSRRRTEVLIMTALMGETYPTELARLLDAPLYSVQTIVDGLRRDGVVARRTLGRMSLVSLDPRYHGHRELKALLLRLSEDEPALRIAASGRRPDPMPGSAPSSDPAHGTRKKEENVNGD
jgi:hypothetical protein